MINFLSQNELCYSIFSIKLDDNNQFSSLRPQLKELVPKGKFPIINFKKYASDYKNGVDFFILLKKHSFSFRFYTEFLDELSRPENQSINEIVTAPDYIVLIVLHSFITWYINFIQNHSTKDILILLQCLLRIMNFKNCRVVSKNRIYAASAFMNAYSELVESTYITNITDIFPPIVEFLTMNSDLPQNAFDLLLKLGNRIIDPTSTKFTKDMYHFVNFVVIIIRTCGPRCPSYMTSVIVSLMKNSLIGLDKDALKFFGRSIKTLGIDTAFSIISELPDSILEKIKQNPSPIFECEIHKNDNGFVFPSNEVIFEYKLVTFPTFETDIRKIIEVPPNFPDLLPPNELISADMLDIFDLIYDIVSNEDKLRENLIKKICSILNTCSLSPYYYDIISAFLYFLLILTKKSPKIEKFPKDIFMSHLFHQNETIFHHDEHFQKINTIRHLAFLLLINQSADTIFEAFGTIRLKPYTFSEFIYRLLPDMTNLSKILEISVPVFESVMNSIVFYQKFQNISEELKTASCEARLAGFTFIDIMLRIPDFRKRFFESKLCVNAMISLAFEKSVRNWTLLKIVDAFYLENTALDYLINGCLRLFHISCEFGFTKPEIQQVESLIRFLDNEAFSATKRADLLRCFEPVISDVCLYIAALIRHASKLIEKPNSSNPPHPRPLPQLTHPDRSNSNRNINVPQNPNELNDPQKDNNNLPATPRRYKRRSRPSTDDRSKKKEEKSIIRFSPSTPKSNPLLDSDEDLKDSIKQKTPPQVKNVHRHSIPSSSDIQKQKIQVASSPQMQHPYHRKLKKKPDDDSQHEATSAPQSPMKNRDNSETHHHDHPRPNLIQKPNKNTNAQDESKTKAGQKVTLNEQPETNWNPKTNVKSSNQRMTLNEQQDSTESSSSINSNSSSNTSSSKVVLIPQQQQQSSQSVPSSPLRPKTRPLAQSNVSLNKDDSIDASSKSTPSSPKIHSNSTSALKPDSTNTSLSAHLPANFRAYYIHLLNKLMNIMTRFSIVHTISQTDISVIDTTASFLYGPDPSDDFYKRLICAIAGEFLQTTEPSFDIKQPKAMKLVINLFNKSKKLLNRINYIVSLCNYSTKNCEQLQKGEFDIFLVGRLISLRNDMQIKKEVFTRALLILRLISAHSCSVSFVHQYVSLLCPIDGETVPRFYQEILDSMQILLQNSSKVPATPLPIFSTTQVTSTNVVLAESFTVYFWFFIYTNQEPITITEIINDSQKFTIQFVQEKISVFFQKKPDQWNGDLDFDLPLNQWSLASFSVVADKEKNQVIVKPAVNGNILPITVFPYFDFSQGMSQVNVGVTKCDKLTVLLGSFGITELVDPTVNITLFDAGPRRVSKNPLFFFTSHNKNDNFVIEVIPSNVTATIQTVRSLHKPSFTDILIEICGVSILVPILLNVNLSFSDGRKLPFLLEQFIEILEMSLTLSYNSQRLFASEKSFLLISNILLSSKHIELSYRAFLRFCSLFESLDNQKCRSHLLFGILMKFDLWIRCESSDLMRILRYWDNSLVPLNLQFVMKKIKFNDIIASLRIFFWYDAVEVDTILYVKERRLFKKDDVQACRNHLLNIAMMMAMQGLTDDEFKFLISQILTLEDNQQIIDLLHFVDNLIDNQEKVTTNSEQVMEPLLYLLFLYSTDLTILELTLNIVIRSYRLSLIKEMNLVNHFELMIHELPGSYAYLPVLNKLLEICESKEPKLFSLCSMIAFSLGKSSFVQLLNTLRPNILYCSTPYWPLWSVISLYKIDDNEFHTRVINFLISISPQQWKNVFWTIDNVGRALKTDQEVIKKKFIIELGNYLNKFNTYDEMSMRQYFNLVPQFLFLRSYFQHNEYLKAIYRKNFKKKIKINISNKENVEKKEINKDLSDSNASSNSLMTPRARPPRPSNYEPRIKKTRMSQMTYGKRSSFHSFDTLSLAASHEKFNKLDFITFKISELMELFQYTSEKVNYKIYFGLRINNENAWEDIDIARMANQLFVKFPKEIYFDSVLFINSFMLHYDPENATKTVSIQKVTKEHNMPYEYSLYNKHADTLHYQKVLDEQPSSYHYRSYLFLQQYENTFHENKSFLGIYNNLKKNDEKAKKLSFTFEIDIGQTSTEIIADFKEKLSLRNTKHSKFWTHFWRSMTIGRAPWRQSLSEKQKKKDIYFKRDFVLCASLCPFRMRPNHTFNNHKKAAQKRDQGLGRSLGKSDTLINLLNSSSNFNQTRSLFSISNSNLLESMTDFGTEPSQIFNATDQMGSSSENIIVPSENSKCVFESTCEIVTVTHSYDALFSLQKECVVITKSVQSARVIKNENITAVLQRTLLHRETAIEIFLDDGISYFVNFPNVKSAEIIKQFKALKKSSQKPFFLQTQPSKHLAVFSKCTTLWQNKKISNFDYLMILNVLSGRSFNNPSQYPVMPWILKDYTSSKLDLNDQNVFRDLSKPVGTLGKEKFEDIKRSMESLPYLFSSGYVSPLIVFLWLVRVEPFTTLQIKEQDEQFDAADRQFKSIAEAFDSVLKLSSDFRELIPEFYFQPEFLVNLNKFDLGVSNGKKVDDVELPNWIDKESKEPIVAAYEFIYLHRKALESEYVSAHLNEWIDLIWGDKSRGQKAIESDNVFCPEMYPEIWDKESELDLVSEVPTIEAILSYVGQIPKQLFDKPHPIRLKVEKTVLDNKLTFKIKNQNRINVGTIVFLSDLKTIALLTIDSNGACIENDIDINDLIKSCSDFEIDEKSDSNLLPQSSLTPNYPSPTSRSEKIRRASSQKFISFLNLNEADGNVPYSRNSTDLTQIQHPTIEKGNSHFEPSKFDQTLWMPAFSSPTVSSSSSLFDSYYGFNASNQGPNSSLNNGNSSISLWKKFFIVDSYQKSDLYLLDPKSGKSERVVRQRNDITAISTDGCKWLAVANKDSKIYLYSFEGTSKSKSSNNPNSNYLLKVQFSIPSFRDFVKCCDISSTFHSLVCGTRDNSLMFCSMTSHSIIKIVDLDAKPIQLLITLSWGFTVVYMRSLSEGKSTHYLAVFGTNGYLIRKVEIENSVKKMTTWRDEKGFDFVLFADSKNRVFAFEAFYCQIGNPIFESSSNVINLSYMESHHTVVTLCENGMVFFIPATFN